jgi:hypothetical protein
MEILHCLNITLIGERNNLMAIHIGDLINPKQVELLLKYKNSHAIYSGVDLNDLGIECLDMLKIYGTNQITRLLIDYNSE